MMFGEKVNLQKSHTIGFHLYRTLENANYSDTGSGKRQGGGEGVMNVFSLWIVMVSSVYMSQNL